MFESSKGTIVIYVPHTTLGDNIILFEILAKLFRGYSSYRFILFINHSFVELYLGQFEDSDLELKRLYFNPWRFSGIGILGESWRKLNLISAYFRIFLAIFPRFKNVTLLGPDWMIAPESGLNLVNPHFRKLIPSVTNKDIKVLKETRSSGDSLGLDHRNHILNQLAAIGLPVEAKGEIQFKSGVGPEKVDEFIKNHRISLDNFIICFLGAGDESRDWTTAHKEELTKMSLRETQLVFIGSRERKELISLKNMLQLVSYSRLVVSNDTGWAHCAIAMGVPLVCISTIQNEKDDPYIKESSKVTVIRPKRLMPGCSIKCSKHYYHCISAVSLLSVIDVIHHQEI